jgi:NTP pyrophosphatase (non-canonical NTP hydrolase)
MISETDKRVLRAATEAWGVDAQIDKAIEEMGELLTALMKAKLNRGENTHMIENIQDEIADVSIMMDQLTMIFGASTVKDNIRYKIDRLAQILIDHNNGEESTNFRHRTPD